MAIRNGTGRGIGLAALLVFGGVSSARAQFGEGPTAGNSIDGPTWYTIHALVDAKLEKADLSQLARSMAKAKPTLDPAQLMERLNILVRAGDRAQADRVIQAMAHTSLAHNAFQSGGAADFLIAHGDWELARHLLDVCPLAMPSSKELFVAHFEDDPAFPNMDSWLAYREHLNPAVWTSTYLEYRRAMGTLRPLLNARAADIRAHPQDLARIDAYVTVASRFERRPNIAWLPGVCHFRLAVENLAAVMKLRDWPAVSIPFLERALHLPITSDDYVWLETQNGATPADFRNEPTAEAIQLEIKSVLMERYRAVQQSEKAQKLQQEITAQAPTGLFWHFSPFLNQTQVGSDTRAIEQRIQATEAENRSDWRYWLTRADFYIERNAREKAGQAYQKALELTRAEPGLNDWARVAVMNDYVPFLYDRERPLPAINWLRSELKQTPIAGDYARALIVHVVRLMPLTHSDFLPTNEVLWRYLPAHKGWEPQEERVLRAMIDPVQGEDRRRVWERAEQLAEGDPGRERILGDLMESRGEATRAIPLRQAADQQTKSATARLDAALADLDAALTAEDWPHAWALWPKARTEYKARPGLNRDYFTRLTERLLETAVRSGAKDAAMELFTDWARYDHNFYHETGNGNWQVRFVTRLAGLGLRDRLLRYYHDMAVADPESHVPQDILPVLLHPPSKAQPGGPPYPRPPFTPKAPPETPVNAHALDLISLDMTGLDLTSALQHVCDQAKISYAFALQGCKTQKVTLALKDVPLDQAVQRILDASASSPPLHSRLRSGILMVCPARGPQAPPEPGSAPPVERLKSRVTGRFHDVDLSHSLNALLAVLGVNYSIDIGGRSRIAQAAVSITATDVPAQDVLERLLKTSRYPLSHWIDRNIVWIGMRDNAPE